MYEPLAVVRAHLIDLAPRDESDRAGDQLVKHAHLVALVAADKEIYQPARGRLVLLDKFKLAVRVHRLFRVGADEKYVPKLVPDRGDFVGFLPNLRLFKQNFASVVQKLARKDLAAELHKRPRLGALVNVLDEGEYLFATLLAHGLVVWHDLRREKPV